MIARAKPTKPDPAEAMAALSEAQDRLAATGRQTTYTQAQIAREIGMTRAGVEQMEMAAKLRFLSRFARSHPQSFLDLGGTLEQLGFLRSITLGSANTRRLWTRWRMMNS